MQSLQLLQLQWQKPHTLLGPTQTLLPTKRVPRASLIVSRLSKVAEANLLARGDVSRGKEAEAWDNRV